MKIDAEVAVEDPGEAAQLSRRAEEFGFDCFWVNETKHDPFIQLSIAATSTERIGLGTSIALAFTRSPTTLAYTAWDLQSLSKGRMILGLGSQVKGHIERRFGLEWAAPAPKMREEVRAIRAVWRSWQEGKRLDFAGEFFRLNLMTPFFSPGPIGNPAIPIFVAGVNAAMCGVAGEVADGLHVHPLHTVRYLRDVIRPAVESGAAKSGRVEGRFPVAASLFAAVGDSQNEIDNVKEAYREQISFYASTRSYRKVMELHGWGDVCDRLHELSSKGEWGRMPSEISEEMLEEFVTEGSWSDIGGVVKKKYGDLLQRVRLYLPFDGNERWRSVVTGFRA